MDLPPEGKELYRDRKMERWVRKGGNTKLFMEQNGSYWLRLYWNYPSWQFTCSKLSTETLKQDVKIYLAPCSSVSIVNFEQAIAGWDSQMAFDSTFTAWRVSEFGVFSGPYFAGFGQNTEITLCHLDAVTYTCNSFT